MQIYQPINGYAYNSDTLFLYDFARSFLKPGNRVLEIGAGSGVLGLLCARDVEIKLVMVEKMREMAIYLRENIRVNAICAEVLECDFLSLSAESCPSFDVALSNPPFYHKEVLKSENPSLYAARYEENLPFKELLGQLKRFLKPRGIFVFCFDSKQSDRVFYELKNQGFNAEYARFVHPRSNKEATLVMIQARLGSKSVLKILPPLFVYAEKEHTSEVRAIFKRAGTHSIKCAL